MNEKGLYDCMYSSGCGGLMQKGGEEKGSNYYYGYKNLK